MMPARPCELLAKLLFTLGPTTRDDTRQDPQSTVAIAANTLTGHLYGWGRLSAASTSAAISSLPVLRSA